MIRCQSVFSLVLLLLVAPTSTKMDMDGRWLVVTAPWADLGNIENAGTAFVYDLQSSSQRGPSGKRMMTPAEIDRTVSYTLNVFLLGAACWFAGLAISTLMLVGLGAMGG